MKYFKLILLILTISGCKKETPETCSDGIKNQDEIEIDCGGTCSVCNIQYTETSTHGTNILFGIDTLIITEENNSMSARVPIGSSLKIELTLINGSPWFYDLEQNWSISSFSSDKQTFSNLNHGFSELLFNYPLSSNGDTILLKYFENGNIETKRKILIRD